MSGPPPPVRRTLVTCSNPTCERFGHPGDKAPLKCASCKSARYCDRNCQRRHWRQHKEFCQVWAASSANNGQTLAQIKLKMAHLIWLLRGIPDYVKHMFEEYGYWRKQGRRGFIEFKFYYWEHLDNAINFIEDHLPVYQNMPFVGMPGTPSYAPPSAKQLTLPMRRIPSEVCGGFHEAVQDYMRFTENQKRPNLQQALDVAMQSDDLFVISVTVVLEGTYSTHIYDFLYRSISWQPSGKGPVAAVPVSVK